MTADAFATAFMVLGVEEAQKLIVELPNLEVFLIYDNGNGENQLLMTNGFERYLTKE
ncbi:MAG: hypothetical protein PF541_07230 [Prolixibacteraceae bacterium]|jgi:thiamine biosynthesis lipoprotein|nr:hypothetical protein [Prolixibacteraceae bacterium]